MMPANDRPRPPARAARRSGFADYGRIGAQRVRAPEELAESRRYVRSFWHRCDAVTPGDPVSRYLSRRGLPWLAEHSLIRFRPSCPHPSKGAPVSAMVALLLDVRGNIAALHRTFLTADGAKADVAPQKATIGAFAGCAFRVHEACAEMVVAEGIETAASAAVLLDTPAWSAIACGNLGWRMALPTIVRSVIIAVDRDPAGEGAARAAGSRWAAEGRRVRYLLPKVAGQDACDVLAARGAIHD